MTTPHKNKKPRTQSSMKLFFGQEKNEVSEDEEVSKIEPIQIPKNIQLPNETNNRLRRSSRTKRKKVSDLDNYKIVHRTNMITYQERLKRYKQKNKSEAPTMTPPQRFNNNKRYLILLERHICIHWRGNVALGSPT